MKTAQLIVAARNRSYPSMVENRVSHDRPTVVGHLFINTQTLTHTQELNAHVIGCLSNPGRKIYTHTHKLVLFVLPTIIDVDTASMALWLSSAAALRSLLSLFSSSTTGIVIPYSFRIGYRDKNRSPSLSSSSSCVVVVFRFVRGARENSAPRR